MNDVVEIVFLFFISPIRKDIGLPCGIFFWGEKFSLLIFYASHPKEEKKKLQETKMKFVSAAAGTMMNSLFRSFFLSIVVSLSMFDASSSVGAIDTTVGPFIFGDVQQLDRQLQFHTNTVSKLQNLVSHRGTSIILFCRVAW